MDISDTLLQVWSLATLPGSDFGMVPEELCVRIATVDYNGEVALEQYRENPQKAKDHPDLFVKRVAPRLITAVEILEKFTESFR